MADPVNIRVDRPYANEEEFLDAEAWSITARSMLLIDVAALPEGTLVRCELRLKTGHALVVAEGFAVKHLAATATRPAGLVMRYKRMSAASSEFVALAVARGAETRVASSPGSAAGPPEPSPKGSNPPRKMTSNPPQRRMSSGPPTGPSRFPPGQQQSATSISARTSSKPPKNSSRPPVAPIAARSVSVIPPARRASTSPPTTASGSASLSQIPSAPVADRRQRQRSSMPAAPHLVSSTTRTVEESHRGTEVAKAARSNAAKSDSQCDESVAQGSQHRDSAAMDRLRKRTATKVISTPPDREAILSRLKKNPPH